MLFGLFLTLGVAVLSVALRSYQTSFAQKAGAIGILVSTFLAVYFVSGSWLAGSSRGTQRIVTLRSSLICSSTERDPSQ